MGPSTALLFGGQLTSLPGIVGTLLVLLLVIVVGRIVLALAWRVVLVALAVSLVLWLLGAVGLGPI
ncbi:hypothetical protein [Halobellus rarus]|uniref:Major facilitator superfamily (MFS) profile domain-containing protein n=1 Tax=Halobellus rarus TaxID=1126237 RepID=A0ABD6CJD5_9EURY|nr:hypothetical protein [Halobellus rarus]